MKKYYQILELNEGATEEDIRSAYKRLAKIYHPDINKNSDAESKFKEIKEAYEFLTNKNNKTDSFTYSYTNDNSEEYVSFDFSKIKDVWEKYSQSNYKKAKLPQRGNDAKISIEIDLEDLEKGIENQVSYVTKEYCDKCSNNESFFVKCPECGYLGYKNIINEKSIKIESKTRLDSFNNVYFVNNALILIKSISGMGGKGINGGPNGNLIINYVIKKHRIYNIGNNFDIIIDYKITFKDAIEGCSIDIPVLIDNEVVSCKVPKFIKNNSKIRIKNKGIRVMGEKNSDIILNLEIQTPTEDLWEKSGKDIYNLDSYTDKENKDIVDYLNERRTNSVK